MLVTLEKRLTQVFQQYQILLWKGAPGDLMTGWNGTFPDFGLTSKLGMLGAFQVIRMAQQAELRSVKKSGELYITELSNIAGFG